MMSVLMACCLATSLCRPVTLEELFFRPKSERVPAFDKLRGHILASFVKPGMTQAEAGNVLGVTLNSGGGITYWFSYYETLGVSVSYTNGKVSKVRVDP